MGDEEHGAAVVGEEGFEPLDGLDVEVVGGLVEQQHVGLGDQRARQQHAAAPAARERVDRHVGGQVQTREHQLDALFEAPAVALFQFVLQPAHAVERLEVAVRHFDRRVVISRCAASAAITAARSSRPCATTSNTASWVSSGTSCTSRATCTPVSRHTVPASGVSSPLTICMKVDLPVPFLPMSARRSPGWICSETSSSRGRWP